MNQSVGKKVSAVRESRNITQDDLAARCALPLEVIQKIEDGLFIPSLSPLLLIARTLGVRLGTFLDDTEQNGPVKSSGSSAPETIRTAGENGSSGNLEFRALALDKAGRHMEPFLITVHPDSSKNFKNSSHEGEEFLYVLHGEIEINYGAESYKLQAGESIYYDSIVEHNVHCVSGSPAQILAVVYAP